MVCFTRQNKMRSKILQTTVELVKKNTESIVWDSFSRKQKCIIENHYHIYIYISLVLIIKHHERCNENTLGPCSQGVSRAHQRVGKEEMAFQTYFSFLQISSFSCLPQRKGQYKEKKKSKTFFLVQGYFWHLQLQILQ